MKLYGSRGQAAASARLAPKRGPKKDPQLCFPPEKKTPWKKWQPHSGTKALRPGMVQRQKGHCVVVTSLMGLFSSPLRSGYCGAKHALHGFFEALRAEHHDDGLNITMVCPGFIRTNISLNAVVGDGSKQGSMDAKTGAGMTAMQCAERMVRAVERRKAEVLIGRHEIIAAYLKRWAPGLLRRVVRSAAVT